MKIIKSFISALVAFTIGINAYAVPARPGLITVIQPDGTALDIKKIGDEYMHFVTTADGTLIVEDADGFYSFAALTSEGNLVSTGRRVSAGKYDRAVNISDVDMQAVALGRDIAVRRSQTVASALSAGAGVVTDSPQRAPQTGMGLVSSTYPRTGSPKGLIILVEYSDVKFNTSYDAREYFNEMINGENFTQYNATGSAYKYFTEQSNGIFQPSFDVLGPVTLPNPMSYYGGNNSSGNDSNPHMMAVHAVQILDPDVDFSQYDTDKDGLIDNVFIFYAGQGEASYGSANSVWPHSWDVRYGGVNLWVDGVMLGHYACSNEWERNRPDGVGTFVHEFSHVMGLPDLYATDNGPAYYVTPGDYSVLDSGPYNNNGCTPPNYGAFELNALGWIEPIVVTGPASITLDKITSGQFVLIPTEKTTEFFLFENRQLEGWDRYIPYHGMLVWHIDYVSNRFASNTVNNDVKHQYVDLVEAGGNAQKNSSAVAKQSPFPGTTNNTEFSAATNPAFCSWGGKDIDLPITGIKEENGKISFDVAGGGSPFPIPETIVPEVGAGDTFFTASWNPVDGAVDYILTVVAHEGGPAGTESTAFDRSEMPAGWTVSSECSFETGYSNYGITSPSLKLGNNVTLTSPELLNDVVKLSFWYKGVSTMSMASLSVEGRAGDTWTQIIKVTPPDLTGMNAVIEDEIPAGIRQIRFVSKTARGGIAIDDISLDFGGPQEVLPDYDGISTSGKTSVRIDRLKPDHKYYYFTVAATDGEVTSLQSAPVFVEVPAMAGIENVVLGGDDCCAPEYFNLQGVRIESPAQGTVVIERRGSAVRKIVMK